VGVPSHLPHALGSPLITILNLVAFKNNCAELIQLIPCLVLPMALWPQEALKGPVENQVGHVITGQKNTTGQKTAGLKNEG